ncbi:NAD-dependent epimerase/dehydratase family protein [Sphingomonas gilva]|uniref:NAD-dependent epimerase/dehydratase family protein n=1 Tax=Sphingomonas gilva TaxID=2305907 RepID=A0A396RP25_9SPHN|nr:NAD-dependent epimerase/dehydratase family protein [Sphingomonas gilva]RHW17546.1 NAD-dependent epimerase/dehydratase family protein [Sphingomonas gilva]
MKADRDLRPVLITGGAGFIGANLADRLASAGHRVLLYDALARPGVERNVDWLRARHRGQIDLRIVDIREEAPLSAAVGQAKAVFHFAAQVAVTTSLSDPIDDFETNAAGTLRLLEAVRRHAPETPLIFASTNKVYGDLADLELALTPGGYRPLDRRIAENGVAEQRPLDFHSPYGCSKGAADQYVLDYARSYGLRTAVMRMSCIYGQRQMGNEDQGWVAHFLIRALRGEPITLYGDGHQVRDILDVSDAVDAYLAAWAHIDRIAGQALNLGGGPRNAVSLRTLIAHIGRLIGSEVELRQAPWRKGDQHWFVADSRAARAALGLAEPRAWREGVADLAAWLTDEHAEVSAQVAAQ